MTFLHLFTHSIVSIKQSPTTVVDRLVTSRQLCKSIAWKTPSPSQTRPPLQARKKQTNQVSVFFFFITITQESVNSARIETSSCKCVHYFVYV